MVNEHLARYDYVGKFIQDSFPELMSKKLNILDLASARGYGSANLKKQFGDATVTGIEFRDKYVEKAQKKYGKLPLERVMAPAILLARKGFALAWEDADDLHDKNLTKFPESRRIFQRDGDFYNQGELFRQPRRSDHW